jgi:hypothetical protein
MAMKKSPLITLRGCRGEPNSARLPDRRGNPILPKLDPVSRVHLYGSVYRVLYAGSVSMYPPQVGEIRLPRRVWLPSRPSRRAFQN